MSVNIFAYPVLCESLSPGNRLWGLVSKKPAIQGHKAPFGLSSRCLGCTNILSYQELASVTHVADFTFNQQQMIFHVSSSITQSLTLSLSSTFALGAQGGRQSLPVLLGMKVIGDSIRGQSPEVRASLHERAKVPLPGQGEPCGQGEGGAAASPPDPPYASSRKAPPRLRSTLHGLYAKHCTWAPFSFLSEVPSLCPMSPGEKQQRTEAEQADVGD